MSSIPIEEPFYLFMHIPKTAGTTLRTILDAQFGEENVLTYYNQQSTQMLDHLDALLSTKPAKALVGHFPFGVHIPLRRPAPYITFVRDPKALIESSYREIAKGAGPVDISDVVADGLSLAETIDRHPLYFQDPQVSYLLGKTKEEPFPDDAVDQALSRIDTHFVFTGLTERFDESILILSRKLGWRPCLYFLQNVGHSAGDMSLEEGVERRLDDFSARDLEFYEALSKRFDHLVASQPPEFPAALNELQNQLKTLNSEQHNNYRQALIQTEELPAVARYLQINGDGAI